MAYIEGVEEFTGFLRRYPLEANRIIAKALRDSMRPIAAAARRGAPLEKWRKLVRVRSGQSKKTGRLYATAGYGGKRKGQVSKKDAYINDPGWEWSKAYWMNNGTLRRRDPSHQFEYGIRGRSLKNRNQQGITPRNFYEKSVDGADVNTRRLFIRSIERQHQRLINSNVK